MVNVPVELAESPQPAAEVYGWALKRVKLAPPFSGNLPSPGVLIRRTSMRDSILYLFASESARDESIDIRDEETGARLELRLGAGRGRLLLLDRHSARIIAAFGNE